MGFIIFLGIIIIIVIIASIKQIGEYERGIKFTMGKYSKILEKSTLLHFAFKKKVLSLLTICVCICVHEIFTVDDYGKER